MAQANITPVVNIPPFKGTENKNFEDFERQLVSSSGVAGIQDADRHLYLHLHFKGGALAFYDQLPQNTRQVYDAAIASLRQRYVNPQRAELKRIVFNQRKYKPSSETVHDFLTDLQRIPRQSFSDVEAQQAANGRPAVAAENRQLKRTRRVREALINGLRNKMKRLLLNQSDTMLVELCEKVARRHVFEQLFPEDNDETAFHEFSLS